MTGDRREVPEWTIGWDIRGRSLALMEAWDSRRGIILASHDDSAEELLHQLLRHLQPEHVIELGPELSEKTWAEELSILAQKEVQEEMFAPPVPNRICVVVREMEKCSEKRLNQLKHMFENSVRLFSCLATTRDPDRIDQKHSSYMWTWKKLSRPRRPT